MKRLLLLLMLVSQPAWAGWERLAAAGEGADEFTVYFDPATVRKTANGRRAWTMTSHAQPQTESSVSFRSAVHLTEFDCAGGRSRALQWSWHSGPMGGGNVVANGNVPGRWGGSPPRSIGDLWLQAVCGM
jgi:hypothetical protein